MFDSQGNLLRTLTTDGVVFGSPALADINGDGYLDIMVGTERLGQGIARHAVCLEWKGFFIALELGPEDLNGQNLLITSSPVIADIDPSSPRPGGVVWLGTEICVSQCQWTAASRLGDPNSVKPTCGWASRRSPNSPAVADIDNDGNLEIVAAARYTR